MRAAPRSMRVASLRGVTMMFSRLTSPWQKLRNVDVRHGVDVLKSLRYVSEDSGETAHIQLTLRQDVLQRVSRTTA